MVDVFLFDFFGTLGRFEVDAPRAVFVGDSYEADYQGPAVLGMDAFLIDPLASHPIPANRRLATVLELAERH